MSSAAVKPDLRPMGRDALVDVLETLLSQPVIFGIPTDPVPARDAPDALASTVHFQGPQVWGTVRMQLPVAFAAEVARVLIGLHDIAPEAPAVMADTVGELGNMVSGKVVTQLATRGFPCVLGTPFVVRGPWLPWESLLNGGGVDGIRLDASCAGHPLSLQIQCHFQLP